jgi:hypothetical protein
MNKFILSLRKPVTKFGEPTEPFQRKVARDKRQAAATDGNLSMYKLFLRQIKIAKYC